MKRFSLHPVFILFCFAFLGLSACYVTPSHNGRPSLTDSGRKVPMLKTLPPGCHTSGSVSGWGRAHNSSPHILQFATNDLRNNAAKRGAQAVLFKSLHISGTSMITMRMKGLPIYCKSRK